MVFLLHGSFKGFLALKNSRSQKLKLKDFKAHTQEIGNSGNFGSDVQNSHEIDVFEEILTNLSNTQGFF